MPYTAEHKLKSKERILLSATELFCRFGFDKVSINQVMKLAKMTHGAFYAHFESKEALYKASFLQTLDGSTSGRLAKAPFSINHLTQLASNLLNLRALSEQSRPSPENILFNEIGSDSAEIRQLYEKSYLSILKILEKRITALCKLKKLSLARNQATIADRSRVILASLVGAVAIAKSIQSEEERCRILSAAQDQILIMLGVVEFSSDLTTID
ncbi:MAG: TetR/AcrR family transcriptional regulator [Gammaproteobacteria bacterium]|nr:TetR/AcrR family transcriptional regulator [Gammaproteobacteria bacterium]